MPLKVELGPGLLGKFYNGVQRTSIDTSKIDESVYLLKSRYQHCLDGKFRWLFNPKSFKQDDILNQGDIFSTIPEKHLLQNTSILVPPQSKGKITFLAPLENYQNLLRNIVVGVKWSQNKIFDEPQMTGQKTSTILGKANCQLAFFTGMRVIDSLFPLAKGGTCAFPGAFGCGKAALIDFSIRSKSSHANVYVRCGERGNEMVEIIDGFSNITVSKQEKCYSLMEKSCVLANTVNMPVRVDEASIQNGITIAEYLRDMEKRQLQK